MKSKLLRTISLVLTLCLVVTLGLGCGNGEEPGPTPGPEKVTIVIGDLTDFTGPGSPSLKPISWALADYADYINQNELIPGVELKIVAYDTKYDTSRFSPGYEWLREEGAQVIFTAPPYVAQTLKARSEADETPIVCLTAVESLLTDPAWVFCMNNLSYDMHYDFLEWIAENDWDYNNGIPKIGMVGYDMSPNPDQAAALEDYCTAHPDKFDLVGITLVPYGTVTWSAEVNMLKDCDYVDVGPIGAVMPTTFIDQYRSAGYTGRVIGSDSLAAYQGAVVGKVGWTDVDGTLTTHGWGWWTLDAPEMELVTELLFTNHPSEAYDIRRAGVGGAGGGLQTHFFLQLVKAVIEEVGAENFDGPSFYEAAQNTTVSIEGCGQLSYVGGDRGGRHEYNIWRWSAEAEDLVLASDGWLRTD